MSFSNSYEIFFSEEEGRDNLVRLDGQRLRGQKRPMRVAPILFALPVAEVFDFVGKRLVQEEWDRLWSRAIQPDVHAPTPQALKPGFRPHSAHKKVREVELDPNSDQFRGGQQDQAAGHGPQETRQGRGLGWSHSRAGGNREAATPGGAQSPGQPLRDGNPVTKLAEARCPAGT